MEPAPAWDGGRSSPAAVGRGARGPACASLLPGGCAPGRQGPRLPPRPAEAPGSVKRPLAPRGRRAPPGAPVAAARWAWPCRPSRPNLLPSVQNSSAKKRERHCNLLAFPPSGQTPGARTKRGARRRALGGGRSRGGGRTARPGSCRPRSSLPPPARRTRDGAESPSPSSALPPTRAPNPHPDPRIGLPLRGLPTLGHDGLSSGLETVRGMHTSMGT